MLRLHARHRLQKRQSARRVASRIRPHAPTGFPRGNTVPERGYACSLATIFQRCAQRLRRYAHLCDYPRRLLRRLPPTAHEQAASTRGTVERADVSARFESGRLRNMPGRLGTNGQLSPRTRLQILVNPLASAFTAKARFAIPAEADTGIEEIGRVDPDHAALQARRDIQRAADGLAPHARGQSIT